MKINTIRTGLLVFFATLLLLTLPVYAYSDSALRFYNQGNAFVQSENYTLAIGAYDHAIALEPKYFEAYDGKADALNRAGEFNEALAASTQALEVNPDYVKGWINRGQILYNIGYYYEDNLKNQEKADEYYREQLMAFEKAIRIEPENADAWFNKAYALAGMKKYDDAIIAFDKVQSLDPAYPNLNMSQNQARILRDAATPVYIKYLWPVAGFVFFLIIGGIFWFWRQKAAENDNPEPENRKGRRKKDQ
jgi:tetratricopeptide (TPR) repeat protein